MCAWFLNLIERSKRIRFGIYGLLVTSPLLYFFFPTLCSDRALLFRDAGHYYRPLYKTVQNAWTDGRVPLWNPYDNLGQPLAADVTAGVYYPGQLILWLPGSYHTKYHLFLMLHLLWAVAGIGVWARCWKCSLSGAALAAASYALGGQILFQYCNAAYLIGASWLPWNLLALDRVWSRGGRNWTVVYALTLAMPVLGGDLQTAYMAVLVGLVYAACCWRRRPIPASRKHSMMYWLGGCALAAGMAAVQVLPAWEYSRTSDRTLRDAPRNVWEWLGTDPADRTLHAAVQGMVRPPTSGTHRAQRYQYSVGPWRWMELLCPNLGGQLFPVNRRWLRLLPAESPAWSPTLYMGILPFWLAVTRWRLRSRSPRIRWLSWIVLLGMLGSLGWFGLGWLLHEFAQGLNAPQPPPISPSVGGLYWILSVSLPGFVLFRYPAKLWTLTAIGVSLLAARGWDRTRRRPGGQVRIQLAATTFVGMALYASTGQLFELGMSMVHDVTENPLFGPFDVRGSVAGVRASLMHMSIVAALGWLLLSVSGGRRTAWQGLVLVAVTCCELAIAHAWLLPTVPESTFQQLPATVAELQHRMESERGLPSVCRTRSVRARPERWKTTSSRDRFVEILERDRLSLYPKYHQDYRLRLVNAPGSTRFREYHALWQAMQTEPLGRRRDMEDLLGVTFRIFEPDCNQMDLGADRQVHAQPGRPLLAPNHDSLARAWIAHALEHLPLSGRATDRKRQHALSKLLIERGRRAFTTPFVECPREWLPLETWKQTSSEVSDHIEWLRDEPGHMELRASLSAPGLLVMTEAFATGWRVEAVRGDGSQRLKIVRTNRVMQGVFLDRGQHHLIWTYAPASHAWGLAISAFSLTLIGTHFCCQMRWPR